MSKDTNLVRRDERMPEKPGEKPTVAPAVDIYENADEILLIGDLPGVSKNNLTVRLEADVLTLEGHRAEVEEKGLIACEFRALDYHRSFALPQGIDPSNVAAELDNGVLRVHLPKPSALRPRKIEVKTG